MSQSSKDAVALLKADHRKVEKLFESFKSAKQIRSEDEAGAGNLYRTDDSRHH